jgi:hypothetical protein
MQFSIAPLLPLFFVDLDRWCLSRVLLQAYLWPTVQTILLDGLPTFFPPVFPAKGSSREFCLVFSLLSWKRWASFPIA